MDKGSVDKYRRSIPGSGLGRVEGTSVWGSRTAEERYGPLKFRDGAPMPADKSQPEDKQSRSSDRTFNDVTHLSGRGDPPYHNQKPRSANSAR